MLSKISIPSYTIQNRKADTTYWLLNNCLSNIKGFVYLFGWESLQTHVENDDKPIPPKYQALLTMAMRSTFDECENEDISPFNDRIMDYINDATLQGI